MKDKQLYLYWLYLFIFCAALGFIQSRGPLVMALLTIAGLAFFVPPAMLLYRDVRSGDRRHLRPIAIISLCSLLLSAALLLLYWALLARSGSDVAANIAYAALAIFSSPMLVMPAPALSMFLWACLLFTAFHFRKKKKST